MTNPADKGFVLVPVEPTREMWAASATAVCALQARNIGHHDAISEAVYAAMLSASPTPVLSGEAGEMVERLNRWHWETTNQWSDEYSPRRSWEKQVSDAMKQWGEASDNAASLISTLVRERDALEHDVESAGSLRLRLEAMRQTAETSQREVERLREALRPFAADDAMCSVDSNYAAARAALKEAGNG